MNRSSLIAFENHVADLFKFGKVNGPIHLSGGNESQLIEIFKDIKRTDWVFSTWRAHYHALLHGVPEELVLKEIVAGRSLNLKFPECRFFTSAIVGGCLPIAVGVAAGIKRRNEPHHVWCFIGDMAASIGTFHDAFWYAEGNDLPVTFVVEDNGHSVTTPTDEAWGTRVPLQNSSRIIRYQYENSWPHWGTRKGVAF